MQCVCPLEPRRTMRTYLIHRFCLQAHEALTADVQSLQHQYAEDQQNKARLVGDLAQLAQEIPRLQKEYIERLRQKEALTSDIAAVKHKLRQIAQDTTLKPDIVYIDEDDDVPLSQRLKREA